MPITISELPLPLRTRLAAFTPREQELLLSPEKQPFANPRFHCEKLSRLYAEHILNEAVLEQEKTRYISELLTQGLVTRAWQVLLYRPQG